MSSITLEHWQRSSNYIGKDLSDLLIVRVVNLPMAPKANTMGMCYVADQNTGEFIGMVMTASLETV